MFNFSSVSESFAGKLHNHRVGLRALRGGRTREGAPPLLKTSRVGGQDDPSARARGRERYRGLPYVLAAVNATRVGLLICLECVSTVPVHCTALHCTLGALHYCASTKSTRREVHRLWAAQHALWPLGSIVAHVRALLKLSVGNVEDLDSRRTCVTLRHACTCCVCSDCSGLQHSSERQSGTSPL